MPKILADPEEKLLAEARRQIDSAGYGAMTIRSVAKACGVSVGTVYNYFPSKDALVAAYMLRDWQRCMDQIISSATQAQSAEPIARSIFEQLKLYSARNGSLFGDPSARASFAGAFSQYHSLLRTQLAHPLRRFCAGDFAAEFAAEALLTWTMAGKTFDELFAVLKGVFSQL